jgi:hypothetical protein
MLFLDPGILQHGQVEISRAATPFQYMFCICLETRMKFAAPHPNSLNTYTCICSLSKKRVYELYLRPSFHSRPDVVPSFSFYQAHYNLPSHKSPESSDPLYHAVKNFYLEVEGSSIVSLAVLQVESSWLFTNLDMLYTQQLSCLLVLVLAMYTLLVSMLVER